MSNVVSYAYFRNANSIYESPKWNANGKVGRQFEQFLPMLVRAHQVVWAGWKMYVYHDYAVTLLPYWPAMVNLRQAGIIELISMTNISGTLCGRGGMIERMRPIWKEGVNVVACRDIDSVPLPRDRAAVDEFIKSTMVFHVIHDAPAHSGLMGGTSSVRAAPFRELVKSRTWSEFVDSGSAQIEWNKHGADQDHLNANVFPRVKDETFLHELDHATDICPLVGFKRGYIDTRPEPGDEFSKIIGGCVEPLSAFNYYSVFPSSSEIRECEEFAGIDARKMMVEIAAL